MKRSEVVIGQWYRLKVADAGLPEGTLVEALHRGAPGSGVMVVTIDAMQKGAQLPPVGSGYLLMPPLYDVKVGSLAKTGDAKAGWGKEAFASLVTEDERERERARARERERAARIIDKATRVRDD